MDIEVGPGEFDGFVAAVANVADDWVADVGEMATELVAASRFGIELDEGVASGVVAFCWIRQIDCG